MLLACLIAPTVAASLPEKAIGRPKILKQSTYKLRMLNEIICSENGWGVRKAKDCDNAFWRVWSDRSNDTVYSDELKTSIKSKLPLGEELYIAEIKGDMAHVYKSNKPGTWPNIPLSIAKEIGWVKMQTLLLWDTCPTDERGVQYKAIIAQNIKKIGQTGDFNGKSYDGPNSKVEYKSNLRMDMSFFYIMKETEDGGKVLLCEGSKIYGRSFLGWVAETDIARWSQRACLEPNWNPRFNMNSNRFVNVYSDSMCIPGSNIAPWYYGKDNGEKESKYRMSPSQLRFPILGPVDDNAKSIKCTAFQNTYTNRLEATDDIKFASEEEQRIFKNRKYINIIFVVEATIEMRDMFPAIKASIAKVNDFENNEGKAQKIRVGAVIYRGSAQGTQGIETVALTEYDNLRLNGKLNSNQANGKLDKDGSVALVQALEKAADTSIMQYEKDQNNLIIIIGNHGSESDSYEAIKPSLLKRLCENNVQLMVIHVDKKNIDSNNRFNDQMITNIVLDNIKRQYAAIGDEMKSATPRSKHDGYNYIETKKTKGNEQSCVFFAQVRNSPTNKRPLTPEEVTHYIDNGIAKFVKTSETWSEHFEEAISDFTIDPNFLRHYLSDKAFKGVQSRKGVIAVEGFAPIKDSDENDYWNYVLYISEEELGSLLEEMKSLRLQAGNDNPDDDRTVFVKAMRALVKAHLGQNDDKGIDDMSEDELQRAIWGINVQAKMNNRINLKDLIDRTTDKATYIKMLDDFRKRYDKLMKYKQEGYIYTLRTPGNKYYWIPIDELP